MSRYVWVSSTDTRSRYYTDVAADPNAPAGYVLSSSTDGSADRDFKTFSAGAYSGGYPAYGTPDQAGTGSGGH